ncbi:MAG: hypothetical protein J6X61_01780 [Clostridia bacterium]|nr:hypothetical protein [Clostridia bacterium]
MSDDKRDERLGRTIVSVAWITFSILFIVVASGVALAGLWFFGGPLWPAPLIGVAAYLIFYLIRLLIWKVIFRLIGK